MRIAVLCNDRIALPALDFLLASGRVVAVGMPDRRSEIQLIVQQKTTGARVPFELFGKGTFEKNLMAWLQNCMPDLVLVKTFPFRIPENVLDMPPYGFINFHYAPLPRWRGSNPVFWMVRNGERTFGVTVHEMTSQIDAGDVLLEHSFPVMSNVNLGIIHSQLAFAGLELTKHVLKDFDSIRSNKRQQDHSQAKWWGHPVPADLFIDWQRMEAAEISDLIRACNPNNKGAATRWKGWTFGISYASVLDSSEEAMPGTILNIDISNGLMIACKNRKVLVAEIIYCEEGYYPGYCMSAFGFRKNDVLI